MNFSALHHQSRALLLANVWDVPSAIAAESAGFKAIGTSSAAISRMLGYEDGEGMSFQEMYMIVSRISSSISIPLTVDLEGGYGSTPSQVFDNLASLHELGVVGINLEDSKKVNGERFLTPADAFAEMLTGINQELDSAGIEMFINARTDTYIVGFQAALAETISRGKLYASCGASGYFVPVMTNSSDIARVASEVPLPLNVMCMPDLPDFATLEKLGVNRISMGNFPQDVALESLQGNFHQILADQSFKSVFKNVSH